MGQKSNLQTIFPSNNNYNLINCNSKTFLINLKFLNFLKVLLEKKNVLLLDTNAITLNNTHYYYFKIFFKSKKILSIKKKRRNIKTLIKTKSYLKLNKFLNKTLCLNQNTLIFFNIKMLNRITNKKLVKFFYQYLKRFTRMYFQRTFNLFIDFIKICSLFCEGKVKSKTFLLFINLIFKSISKKSHIRFISFLKDLFRTIIYRSPFISKVVKDNPILGIKFMIAGRIRDKQRASFYCLQEGSLSTTCLSNQLDYSKIHVYTILGVFGLKIWVSRK